MFVSKKYFKILTKKSLFLPTEKENVVVVQQLKNVTDQTTFDVTSL